jgi:RNA polymerase sigma-70 factor (ECF subfamily)
MEGVAQLGEQKAPRKRGSLATTSSNANFHASGAAGGRLRSSRFWSCCPDQNFDLPFPFLVERGRVFWAKSGPACSASSPGYVFAGVGGCGAVRLGAALSGVAVDDNDALAGLLTQARSGNKGALEALLDRLRPVVRGRAEGLLGRGLGARVDCSDIAQEVHLRIWREFDQFQGETVPQLLAWVETILQHAITDCRRRHGAGKRDAGREEGGDLCHELKAGHTTPSQGAMRNEQQARLDEAIERLPEMQRLVFRLRFFEGLPFEEVAQQVGVTLGNARVLMVRALDRLKAQLRESHE